MKLKNNGFGFLWDVYLPSLLSFVFTLFFFPKILNLSGLGASLIAYFYAFLGMAVVFDLSASQMLGRAVLGRSTLATDIVVRFYRGYSLYFGVGVFFVVLFISLKKFGLDRFVECCLGGIWVWSFFVSSIHVSILQTLKKNHDYAKIIFLTMVGRFSLVGLLIWMKSINSFSILGVLIAFLILENVSYFYMLRDKKIDIYSWVGDAKLILDRKFLLEVIMLGSGALLSQFDRLYLMKVLSNEDYVVYMLISSFAMMILMAQYPLVRYALPRFDYIFPVVKRNFKLIVVVYATAVAVFVYMSAYMFELWSGKSGFDFPVRLMVFGVVCQATYNFFYQYILARSSITNYFKVNLVSFFVLIISLVFIPKNLSAGGCVWAIFSISQMCCFFKLKGINKGWG